MKYLSKPSQTSRKLLGWKDATQKKTHAFVKCRNMFHLVGNCGMQSYLLVVLPHLFTLVYQKSTSKIYLSGQFTWTIWLSNTLRHHNGESFFCEVFGFDLSQKNECLSVEYKRKKVAQHLMTNLYKISQVYMAVRTFAGIWVLGQNNITEQKYNIKQNMPNEKTDLTRSQVFIILAI